MGKRQFDNWTMRDVGQAINITSYYLMEGELKSVRLENNTLGSARQTTEETAGSEPAHEPPTED